MHSDLFNLIGELRSHKLALQSMGRVALKDLILKVSNIRLLGISLKLKVLLSDIFEPLSVQ